MSKTNDTENARELTEADFDAVSSGAANTHPIYADAGYAGVRPQRHDVMAVWNQLLKQNAKPGW